VLYALEAVMLGAVMLRDESMTVVPDIAIPPPTSNFAEGWIPIPTFPEPLTTKAIDETEAPVWL
jgi:hypothetical protein